MADVRLTAINPEDSSVVAVTCDASGRLLLEERGVGPQGPPGEQGPPGQDGQDGDPFSGNFADDVTFGGSASIAGTVECTNWPITGYSIERSGAIGINAAAGTTGNMFNLAVGGIPVASIAGTGDATFGGDVRTGNKAGFTAEGYLWCTTRRGDTVILDATSNGLATWADYTPATRKDEIRDKLDALREETPDTEADTQ